ncbi:hypothetical protein QR680_000383 [Steinernema hermaphroditum]|uniref:UPAR/Ly6 domain-containing protein n=1 Tax=Steinernema hermaphroditum TaxID=289476 RepID=A0AA39GUD7_9BILA|nr:hypothetical protein QR680_000383 [Steinernema hermaphroditum]
MVSVRCLLPLFSVLHFGFGLNCITKSNIDINLGNGAHIQPFDDGSINCARYDYPGYVENRYCVKIVVEETGDYAKACDVAYWRDRIAQYECHENGYEKVTIDGADFGKYCCDTDNCNSASGFALISFTAILAFILGIIH